MRTPVLHRQANKQAKWFTKNHVEAPSGAVGSPIGLLLSLTHSGAVATGYSVARLGAHFWVNTIELHVTEAFDGGSDAITIGYDGAQTAYSTSKSLTSTGVQTISVTHGIDSSARVPKVFYSASASPTTGRVYIVLNHIRTIPTS